mmetsp:Transcript_36332/g.117468  ORF Transcript_36332/g.117468 Transcript_36332/m.117468 type:complete len:189 (-) Transcript_36332:59-625(-)
MHARPPGAMLAPAVRSTALSEAQACRRARLAVEDVVESHRPAGTGDAAEAAAFEWLALPPESLKALLMRERQRGAGVVVAKVGLREGLHAHLVGSSLEAGCYAEHLQPYDRRPCRADHGRDPASARPSEKIVCLLLDSLAKPRVATVRGSTASVLPQDPIQHDTGQVVEFITGTVGQPDGERHHCMFN